MRGRPKARERMSKRARGRGVHLRNRADLPNGKSSQIRKSTAQEKGGAFAAGRGPQGCGLPSQPSACRWGRKLGPRQEECAARQPRARRLRRCGRRAAAPQSLGRPPPWDLPRRVVWDHSPSACGR